MAEGVECRKISGMKDKYRRNDGMNRGGKTSWMK